MSNKTGRDLPAVVRAAINSMVLAIARKQLTQEQAMQEVARLCLTRQANLVNEMLAALEAVVEDGDGAPHLKDEVYYAACAAIKKARDE